MCGTKWESASWSVPEGVCLKSLPKNQVECSVLDILYNTVTCRSGCLIHCLWCWHPLWALESKLLYFRSAPCWCAWKGSDTWIPVSQIEEHFLWVLAPSLAWACPAIVIIWRVKQQMMISFCLFCLSCHFAFQINES